MKRVVILQSNYIPWRGYFDLIRDADVFIFYDEVQYTRRDWRNRNKIVTSHGEKWLSIPVSQSGKYDQSVWETQISDPRWADKHWSTLKGTYAKSPGFAKYGASIEKLYSDLEGETFLSAVNHKMIKALAGLARVDTEFMDSQDIPSEHGKTERLVGLCKAVGGTHYISGPAAKAYIETEKFDDAGIELIWKTYPAYPGYEQLDVQYRPGVSIIDTLFQFPEPQNYWN